MKIKKIVIPSKKLDKNFLFYQFLKEINGSNGLNEHEIDDWLNTYYTISAKYECILNIFNEKIDLIKKDERKENLRLLLEEIRSSEIFNIFIFALKLIQIKPLLLAEAKITTGLSRAREKDLHPLSLEYDTLSKHNPYYTRVNGALLALLFFNNLESGKNNFISDAASVWLSDLVEDYKKCTKYGIEPNQMFMLMFTESVNQSIVSSAGNSYEERIYNVLLSLGLDRDNIKKGHDPNDPSTEYDFFFKIGAKTFGISAKRTLRERYKQFIKTLQTTPIDVSIEITLGLDLSEEKAKTIRQHNTYLFVSDEIYNSRTFLQQIEGVYKASDLSLKLLKKL